MVNINSHFDGSSDIENEPVGENDSADLTWSGYLPFYSVYDDSDGRFYNVNASFSGSDWTVAYMAFHAKGGSKAVISDSGSNTNIGVLALGENSDIVLKGTQVNYIEGWGGVHDITLGSRFTETVRLGGDSVKLKVGSGGANTIGINADATVVVDGRVETMSIRDGDHSIRLKSGQIKFLDLGGNDNTVVLEADTDVNAARAYTETGLSKFDIKDGGDMRVLTSNGGDLEITMEGSGRIRNIEAFEGTLNLTTDERYVQSLVVYDSVAQINIGSGGIGAIQIGSGSGMSHVISAEGSIDSLTVFGEDSVKLGLGDGGVGTLRTGKGNDKVNGGNGNVDFLNTRDGNDTVVTGSGYFGVIHTGEGRDKVTLKGDAGTIRLGGGNDKFFGGSEDDFVVGGSGNDLMKGGGGEDIFLFSQDSGNDKLRAFKQGDDLMLIHGHEGGFDTLSITKAGRHKVIEHDGGTIKLLGLGKADITEDDFSFI
ncbi:MAG: calcium-binding protein [Rhodobacteraceae bacterium]|nr:calcium-binding protein [Paracoccaceae bacterium]